MTEGTKNDQKWKTLWQPALDTCFNESNKQYIYIYI